MASKTDIANRTLTKLGEKRVTSLDENSKAAATISSMFDIVRDAELRANTWHFSKARIILPALSTSPAFGFRHAFQLPADCLRVIQIGNFLVYPHTDTRGLFSIEGRQILTDLGAPLPLRYVRQVTDCSQFDALFVELFACRLGVECAEPLAQSTTKAQSLQQQYTLALRAAVRINAVERPSQPIADDTWIESRGYSGDFHHHGDRR